MFEKITRSKRVIVQWVKNWWQNKQTMCMPKIYTKKEHLIGHDSISASARRVCEVLRKNGFAAFVVGGAVRDLLLNRVPKDFDVATNATPEEVQRAFKHARIIGRRFKIVHVRINHETIEVTTFRAKGKGHISEEGRLLSDNQFGSQAEDAARRDFTVNALYFEPFEETIVDYFDGVSDLKKKKLVVIGQAEERFREDPVRMLRAVRLAAKLQLEIELGAVQHILKMATLLKNEPPARLFDETVKIFTCGQSLRCLRQLRELGLADGVLPLLDAVILHPQGKKFIRLALGNTDRRIAQGKGISTGFLFATLLWQEVRVLWEKFQQKENTVQALQHACDEILQRQAEQLAVPRRILGDVVEIWMLQPRFEKRVKNRAYKLLSQSRFRAAFDFLGLRAQMGEVAQELWQWWEDFQFADEALREKMLMQAGQEKPKLKKRRRRKFKPHEAASS